MGDGSGTQNAPESSTSSKGDGKVLGPRLVRKTGIGAPKQKLDLSSVFGGDDSGDESTGGSRHVQLTKITEEDKAAELQKREQALANARRLAATMSGLGTTPAAAAAATAAAAIAASQTSSQPSTQYTSSLDRVPTSKAEIFSYPVDWKIVDMHDIVSTRVSPWVAKKVLEMLGEEDQDLIQYICSLVQSHSPAQGVADALRDLLDDETDDFVCKLWSMVIYETLQAQKSGPSGGAGMSS